MSRSMHTLRKYAGPMMAVFCAVLVITWVAAPFFDAVMSTNRGGGGSDAPGVVVNWTGGSITETDLQQMRFEQGRTTAFLAEILRQTLESGATPQAPGLQRDQNGQIVSLGISNDNSDAGLIQTMLLADKARKEGVAVDNNTVKDYLNGLSAHTLQEGDWLELAKNVVKDSGLGVGRLFERLQTELLAQRMRQMEHAGLFAVPPGQVWDYYLRLHRQAKIEAYAVDVAPLMSRVKEPTASDETELRAIYERGSDQEANPALAEPGFFKPESASFDYITVDFKPFLAAAKKTITEEQIKAEYEKAIAAGQYKVLELPPEGSDTNSKPTTEEPTIPINPNAPAPPTEEPAAAEPAVPESAPATDAQPAAPPASPPADPPAAKSPKGVQLAADPKSYFVSMQAEQKSQPAADAPATPPAAPAPATAAPPAAEQPPSGDPAAPAAATPTEPAPKFKPLEEVREDVINRLAQPIAEDARREAINKVTQDVQKYGIKYNRWLTAQAAKSKTATDPGSLNTDALAKGISGAKFSSTPMVTRYTVGDFEIGQQAYMFDFQRGGVLGFADVAFAPNAGLYQPQTLPSQTPDLVYLFWRTKAEPASETSFEASRKDVVTAWKKQKAFELAKVEAQQLADKASKAKSLKDVVSDPKLVVEPSQFSWLTTGSIAFGMGEPTLSPVAGVEYAGVEFMRAVFAANEGAGVAAPNQPHAKVYVVKVISFDPKLDVLRQQFADTGFTMETMMVARNESNQISAEIDNKLNEEYQVSWRRPSEDGGRNR